VKFFHGVQPTELMRNRAKFDQLQQRLNQMTDASLQQDGSFARRKMECCLKSFNAPCGKAFQIFDTELSLA